MFPLPFGEQGIARASPFMFSHKASWQLLQQWEHQAFLSKPEGEETWGSGSWDLGQGSDPE